MPKLVHAIFVKDEAHCIDRMLDTVLPFVDESYILIDDRTKDNTKEIVELRGCHTRMFTFSNFSKTKNTLLAWVNDKTDWIIGIAPDETIDPAFGKMLNILVPKLQESSIDQVRFPRRHWLDLDKIHEYTKQNWYPDWQSRLLRADFPRIHMVRYVHEVVQGTRDTMHVNEHDIHHFNLYWKPKIDYNWEEMNNLYAALKIKQHQEQGKDIWPDKEVL